MMVQCSKTRRERGLPGRLGRKGPSKVGFVLVIGLKNIFSGVKAKEN